MNPEHEHRGELDGTVLREDRVDGMSITDRELDNPILTSLLRHHARFAQTQGGAVRYRRTVAPFFAVPDEPSSSDWADAASLVGHDGGALIRETFALPADWEESLRIEAFQMVATRLLGEGDGRIERLGVRDVADMAALVDVAKPGPFADETVLLGGYVGIRDEGRLVAMAGQRLRVDGATEISAVATAPTHRGRGLAVAVIRAVAADIEGRGDTCFLQLTAENPARGLYEKLGFEIRRPITIRVVAPRRDPADATGRG